MEKTKCMHCGTEWETKQMTISFNEDESISLFCPKCSKFFGQCPLCEHYPQCGFENDPDPMPQFIMATMKQQTPQGVAIIQKQVPNTERLRKFCLDGKCICCNEENPKDPFCCRFTGFGTCANFKERNFKNFVQDFSMQEASEY